MTKISDLISNNSKFEVERKENNEYEYEFQGKKGEKGKKFHEEGTEYPQY